MVKKEIKDIEELLSYATSLEKAFGKELNIGEIIEQLKSEQKSKKEQCKLDYDDLRDCLIANLVKTLIEKNIVEEKDLTTLGSLTEINLKDILGKYFVYVHDKVNNCSDKEIDAAALFDSYGGNSLELLKECIDDSIKKWSETMLINDIVKCNNELDISIITFEWMQKGLSDDHYCTNKKGSIMELLEWAYGGDSILKYYLDVKGIYNCIKSPYDFTDNVDIHFINVKRTCSIPTEKELFLLVWKYYALKK